MKKIVAVLHIKKIVYLMRNDKKNNSSKINLVLLKNLGRPIIDQQFNSKEIEIFLKNELNNL